LKNYIEAMRPAADADGAMAFFYQPLNSWVLAGRIQLQALSAPVLIRAKTLCAM
jgi:hypothetical protein